MTLVAISAVGLALGVFAAIAPIGPVTLMVLRRALQRDYGGAIATGLGRIPPEMVYVAFASFGMSAVLDRFPQARSWLEAIAAFVLVALGVAFALMKHEFDADEEQAARKRAGFGAGFLVSALNPTLIVSWSAIVAIALSVGGLAPEASHKVVFPLAVGGGIALGYLGLVWTVRRWGEKLEQRAVSAVLKSLGLVLCALGLYHAAQLVGVIG